ncbi:MAG: DUF3987 domain-containing protein [Phycisphaerales bacterium]
MNPPNDAAPLPGGAGPNESESHQNSSPNLAEALRLAAIEWHVFPCHSPLHGAPGTPPKCSCGDPKCDSVGKHPRTARGLKDGTTDLGVITKWWAAWPNANVAVRTGRESGIVVLDEDPRHGGDVTLAELVAKHGALPATGTGLTGGGGRHHVMKHPGVYIKSRNLLPGLDCKGDGGYIVVEPSLHASGQRYMWELSSRPGEVPLAPLPPWLLKLMIEPPKKDGAASGGDGDVSPEGKRNDVLTSLAGSMRRRGMKHEEIFAALKAVNAGRCKPPLDESEVEKIAQSVSRYAPEAGSDGVTAAAWLPPSPLYERAYPFPLHQAFPPGTESVRDYLAAIGEAFQVPVDLPAMMAIAVAGLPLSQNVVVRLNSEWPQPPNQYVAVLMEPGNRKTAPYQELIRPVLAWESSEAERLGPLIAEHNAKIDIKRRRCERLKDLAAGKTKPRSGSEEPSGHDAERAAVAIEQELAKEQQVQSPQLVTGDVTTEEMGRLLAANAERIGAFSDESEAIEVFLGRYQSQPNIQLYNKGYDGSTHRYNRVGRPPVILKRPLITIGFVVQPEGVRDLLESRKAKGTGLIARYAMALPRSLLGHRTIDPAAIPQDLRAIWHRTVTTLLQLELPSDPEEVPLTPEAAELFRAFCAQVEPTLSWCGEFAAFGMQDWGGKLCGRVGRIALVLHGLQFGAGVIHKLTAPITIETMTAAISWSPYLIEHAKAVMGWLGVDEVAGSARRVLAWLARTQQVAFTKRDCFTAVRGSAIECAEDLNRPLELLCDLRYLRPVPMPPQTGPGHPKSPEFTVNPKWDRRTV